jgi:hypothetical protein
MATVLSQLQPVSRVTAGIAVDHEPQAAVPASTDPIFG